jgi:hypothetical protein
MPKDVLSTMAAEDRKGNNSYAKDFLMVQILAELKF